MSDHDEPADHGAHGDDHAAHAADHGGTDAEEPGRVTSPMQEFGPGQVTTGFVVLVVGLVVVFGIPLLL